MKKIQRLLILLYLIQVSLASENGMDENPDDLSTMERPPVTYEVILYEQMENGQWQKEQKAITIWAMEDFWSQYADWEIVDLNTKTITLKKPFST
ncbi:BofC N-terminal domain-containing protein [Aliibacillus thermotolerans]|uniref:BofC N-terminal domain-containing protein n=1 Tax=Aliibacillus thermotolerans TaxID=1834418 RepID=A0ABW0UAJ6_9BACI|nr:BofC N-terminal domain-containing protein [Aliibacillus thermotolerans]MDA3130828.1 hypothetical protein [Aliibacillus thermotolerans]